MGYAVVGDRSCFQWFGVALAIGMLVQACTARAPATTSASGVATDQNATEVPRGAIRIGDQLYQVPIGADDDGCPMFRLYSPTRLVAQVIYYRDAAGRFTARKTEADCADGVPN